MKELMSRNIKYELNPNISGFLMSIFLEFCENEHDEYDDCKTHKIHEYSTCFVTMKGLKKLLNDYNIERFPFCLDDLEMVGCVDIDGENMKDLKLTLTAWLSLWSLLMCYATEIALKYLVMMGAPTIFPSRCFLPKWSDYLMPQIAANSNTHQRCYNALIVTYPFNHKLVQQFIRCSVNEHSAKKSMNYNHPKRQNPHKSKTRMPAASRTGSLSPIVEILDNDNPPFFALDDDEKKNKKNDEQTIQRLNTVFFLKPVDRKSSNKYSYGMLCDEQQSRYIYNQHHKFLHSNKMNKRKPLIKVNLLNKDRGVDAYHILLESWPQNACNHNPNSSGQDQLFQIISKKKKHKKQQKRKNLERNIKKYDAVIYLHSTESLKCSKNIKTLYDFCRDQEMPIIPIQIPFDLEDKTKTNHIKHKESMEQLMEIQNFYDLPQRVIRWESFSEDQLRFTHDLIERLHFREMYVPKTIWQIRKKNVVWYTKKGTLYAAGMGLFCYFAPINSLHRFWNKLVEQRPKNIAFRKKNKEKKKDETNKKQKRWKALIAVAVVTSVFYGGYYIYGKYRYYNMKYQHHDNQKNKEEEENEENEGPSYLTSFFYPTFYDEDSNDEEDDDDLSLTSFQWLKQKKISDSDASH